MRTYRAARRLLSYGIYVAGRRLATGGGNMGHLPKQRPNMPDDPHKTGRDRKFISLEQEHEVRDWARILGCTEDRLREAVQAVGRSAAEVRLYLKRSGPAAR